MRKTKIICTIGPTSNTKEMISKLIDSGMNVARLNFSHGTHESHLETINKIKEARQEKRKPIAILLDTKGPEIRIGKFENPKGVYLKENDVVTLTNEEIASTKERISISYNDLYKDVMPGHEILIDDGRLKLEVDKISGTDIICKIITGGILTDNKGVNIPHIHINMPYLSEKDKEDIVFGIKNDIDFIAASFVRNIQDVIDLKSFLNKHNARHIKIISKIENLEGIENINSILELSDGIMIARGDMGVEVEYEKIPGIQKNFIKKCQELGKIVITATQMLESMTTNIIPTRAEITDVANAVFDGTSAVMLSGETASGKHPDLVLRTMVKIINQAEEDNIKYFDDIDYKNIHTRTNAICDAACITARDINAKAIVAITKSGETARLVSKYRPKEIIIATTPYLYAYYQLALSWGVYPILTPVQKTENGLINGAIESIKEDGILKERDIIVLTAGLPLDISGTTNLLKVLTI